MSMKTNAKIICFIITMVTATFFSSKVFSQQLQQFQHSFTVGKNIQASMIIIGEAWHAQPIDNLLRDIEFKTKEFYNQISITNPNSEISRLGRSKQGGYEIKPEVAEALRNATNLASWSKGAFDITNGNYKKIEVDKKKPFVKLGLDNMKIDMSPIIEGILADYMVKIAQASNANNAIARAGMTFRSMGMSDNGPWKIQIQDSEGTFAHHAMNLTLKDAGVSSNSIKTFTRDSSQKQSQCKGVVIIAREATVAQGIADAVFNLGPAKGLEFINGIPNVRGLIVDLNGRFYRSNNF